MSNYPFIGIPLSPLIAEEHVKTFLLSNSPSKRNNIINHVQNAHQTGGGLPSNNVMACVKKALDNLVEDKVVRRHAYGYYSIEQLVLIDEQALDEVLDLEEISESDRYNFPETEIGAGQEAVYLYFSDSERQLARYENRSYWACKVGMTSGQVTTRILSQGITTGMYKLPTIGLVIKTDDARSLEKALHQALDTANCRIDTSFGKEWFLTSPERLIKWYEGYAKLCAALGDAISVSE